MEKHKLEEQQRKQQVIEFKNQQFLILVLFSVQINFLWLFIFAGKRTEASTSRNIKRTGELLLICQKSSTKRFNNYKTIKKRSFTFHFVSINRTRKF